MLELFGEGIMYLDKWFSWALLHYYQPFNLSEIVTGYEWTKSPFSCNCGNVIVYINVVARENGSPESKPNPQFYFYVYDIFTYLISNAP